MAIVPKKHEMPTQAPEVRAHNFSEVAHSFDGAHCAQIFQRIKTLARARVDNHAVPLLQQHFGGGVPQPVSGAGDKDGGFLWNGGRVFHGGVFFLGRLLVFCFLQLWRFLCKGRQAGSKQCGEGGEDVATFHGCAFLAVGTGMA